MSILLTNDDGVDAPGIAALAEALAGLDDLVVCAPLENRSGVGMGITLGRDLLVKRHSPGPGGVERRSVDGNPADAVKYALQVWLRNSPPRLVVSGINHGPNLGRNVRCSGTVGAAFEAVIAGIPAVAVSVGYSTPPCWDGAKHYVRKVVERTLPLAEKRKNYVLNLNVPAAAPEEVKGLRFIRLGTGGYYETLMPSGSADAFFVGGSWIPESRDDVNDAFVFTQGYATLTPFKFDMTDYELMESLSGAWRDLVPEAEEN